MSERGYPYSYPYSVVTLPAPPEGAAVVVLDRVRDGVQPPYCVFGKATCVNPRCDAWVWLGDRTVALVKRGEVYPLCRDCAAEAGLSHDTRVGQVWDTRHRDAH